MSGRLVASLAAATQMSEHPHSHMVVYLPELMPTVPHFVVAFPAFEVRIKGIDQFSRRHMAVLGRDLAVAGQVDGEALGIRFGVEVE